MGFTTTPSGASCGATIDGVRLHEPLSSDLIAELRAQWLEHKVLIFPKQQLTPSQLVAFSEQFGEIGEDPFLVISTSIPKWLRCSETPMRRPQFLLRYSTVIGVF
jgi:alpha-ketoglutarate-dependent taurine dioxygenase